jgi:hypothetical protein
LILGDDESAAESGDRLKVAIRGKVGNPTLPSGDRCGEAFPSLLPDAEHDASDAGFCGWVDARGP